MRKKKIITYLAALGFILILNFLLPRLLPGDPFMAIYGEEAALSLSEAAKEELRAKMNLDKSLIAQFKVYLLTLAKGDLGYSYALNQPVRTVISKVLPWTLLLVGSALILSTLIGLILGIESGWRRGTRADRWILLTVVGLSALPNFLIGILLLLFFAVQLGWFPLGGAVTPYSGFTGTAYLLDVFKHLFLPLLALTLAQVPRSYLLTRASVLGNLSYPYVRTAAAKGLKPLQIRYKHVGRNSLLPISASLGVSVGSALAGSLFIEIVFSYPGMGSLIHQAIAQRDYPLLQGILLVIALTVILANLATDILASKIDPRIRKE
ncbi:MAG: ABC transporter permease [Peptococcaceae bacterium]|jgi:peptide/nickel transport system permease protein|nr:ABC transporter permease [Peptococcaceae bacterium]